MPVASILGIVYDDLQKVEDRLQQVAHVDYPLLATLLEHILSTGGKRMRPALMLLSAKFNDYHIERLVPLATAVELLHTATLVHDDMIDNSTTRRGTPTLNTIISNRATILVGDYLFAQSAALATESNSIRVMEVFSWALMRICDGELRQAFSTANLKQTRSDYYHQIESKTATLFVAAAQSGAILSHAPEIEIQALADYGYNLGMAFQIIDDVLDFVGDERKMGKPVGSDLRQGTVTLPAIYLLESLPNDHAYRTVFENNRDDADHEEKVRKAVDMIVNSSAIALARSEADDFIVKAKAALAPLPDNVFRRSLTDLADYVLERTN